MKQFLFQSALFVASLNSNPAGVLTGMLARMERGDADSSGSTIRTGLVVALVIALLGVLAAAISALGGRVGGRLDGVLP